MGADASSAGRELARFTYPPVQVERGYVNKTLYVNLSEMAIDSKPVSEKMKRLFIGGRGVDLWLLWQTIGERHPCDFSGWRKASPWHYQAETP